MLCFFCFGLAMMGLLWFCLQIQSVRSYLIEKGRFSAALLHAKASTPGPVGTMTMDKRSPDRSRPFCPPVSVLKPLQSLDDNLFDNLDSFCHQNYGNYEIIFSLDDDNDPAFRVAKKVKMRNPQRRISIVVVHDDHGPNRKANRLIAACRAAKFPYLLISDSHIRVDKDYLRESIKPMENPDVGLVSNLIRGSGGRTIGARLENLYVNSFVLRSVCMTHRFFRHPWVVGKSMVIRKCDLEAADRSHGLGSILAEDFPIARWMKDLGKSVIISNHVVDYVSTYCTLRKFLHRRARWGRLRWKAGRMEYLTEILGNALFLSCLPLIMIEPSSLTVFFAITVASIKGLGEYYLGREIGAPHGKMHYLLSPLKDLLMGPVWFIPFFSGIITGKGNKYELEREPTFSPSAP